MSERFDGPDAVKEALRRDPDNPLALKSMASYLLHANQYMQAKNYFGQSAKIHPRIFSEIILAYEREIEQQPTKIGPRFSLAAFQLGQGNVDAAILEIEEILEISPKNIEAYNVLGKIFLKLGRVDDVITLLEKSLHEGVEDLSLSEILAGAYLEKGRVKDAICFYEKTLIYRPTDKQILRVLGDLYSRTENFNEAAKRYQAMFSDDPEVGREVVQRLEAMLKKLEGNIFVREILSEIYMRLLSPEEAVVKLLEIIRLDSTCLESVIQKIRSILKAYPSHPQATLALAEALRRQGSFSEAIENYYSLAKARTEFIEQAICGYREVLAACPGQALAHAYLAEAYLVKKMPEESLHEFESMLEVEPTSAELIIKKCREIIRQHPDLIFARLVLGRALLAKGDVQRAAVEAEGIVASQKNYAAAYVLLGEAYCKLNLGKKAAEAMNAALTLAPYDVNLQERYRDFMEQEIALSVEKLKEQIAADPWKPALRLELAKLFMGQGKAENAIRELQFVMKDQGKASLAANLLGSIYRGSGRFDLAEMQFKRALDPLPTEAIWVNLGTALEGQGAVNQAIKIYEEVLQADIDFGNLKKRVKYLKQTSLNSIKTKVLQMVAMTQGENDILAFWGREGKGSKKREEVSLSFGQDHNAAGFDFYLKGMYKAALEEFQLAVQLDIKFAAALNNFAVALAKENKLAEARARLEEAVNLDPGSVVFHNNLGLVCFLLGQVSRARAELEKAFEMDAENNGVVLNLADGLYFAKEVERAIELYRCIGNSDLLTEAADRRLRFRTPQPRD